jgi:uncharacterized membrane protein YsdA (DUF1294 family)
MKTLLLVVIGIAFLGFMGSLVARNTGNHKKKTLRRESFYNYLGAVSLIVMLLLAIIYKFFFT